MVETGSDFLHRLARAFLKASRHVHAYWTFGWTAEAYNLECNLAKYRAFGAPA